MQVPAFDIDDPKAMAKFRKLADEMWDDKPKKMAVKPRPITSADASRLREIAEKVRKRKQS